MRDSRMHAPTTRPASTRPAASTRPGQRKPVLPLVLSAQTAVPDGGVGEGPGDPVLCRDNPAFDEHSRDGGESLAWSEPPLPNGVERTYLTSGGAAVVAVAFLVFLAILLAYFSSATSWAPW